MHRAFERSLCRGIVIEDDDQLCVASDGDECAIRSRSMRTQVQRHAPEIKSLGKFLDECGKGWKTRR